MWGVDAQPDKVTFSTSAAILNLSLEDEVLSLELRTRDKLLIDSWEVDVGERVARIGLQNGERVYGFGDKRAAMDQRGQKSISSIATRSRASQIKATRACPFT